MQLLLERHPYQVIRDAWSRAGASVASPVDQHAATADQVPPNSKFTEELDRRHQLVDLFWRYRHFRWYEPKPRHTQRVRWLMLKKNCVFSVQEDFPPPDCARPRGPCSLLREACPNMHLGVPRPACSSHSPDSRR